MRTDTPPSEGIDVLRADAVRAQAEAAARVLAPGEVLWVRACPGAGKTRVIVDRHLAQPPRGRRGRAIASFTRAASREVHSRIVAEAGPASAEHPNTVTTLDTFFWRHLVRPYLDTPREPGNEWNRLDSWGEHPSSAGFDGEISLDDFRFTDSGPTITKGTARKIENMRPTQPEVFAWAEQRHASLTGKGHMTGDQLRRYALANLADPVLTRAIGSALTTRFTELVVDEAQDCSDTDEVLLRRLSELGLPLLLVADTDQAIYGFRRGDEGSERTGGLLPRDTPLRLRHNWRSSQDLCRFTATLRGDPEPDTAVGPHRDEGEPVLLLADGAGQSHPLRTFRSKALAMGIDEEEMLVVAHGWGTLPPELTGTAKPPSGDLARLVWAGEVFSAPTPGKKPREQARRALRSALLDVWCAPEADREGTEAELMRAAGIDAALLDRAEALVRYEFPSADLPLAEWQHLLAASLSRHSPHAVRTEPPGRVRWSEAHTRFRNLPARRLYDGSNAPLNPLPAVGRTSSVHGVKGEEADAVLLMLPTWRGGRSVVSRWLDPRREADEDVRVLYVAATRARRLLALALSESDLGRVAAFLKGRGVRYASVPGPVHR